LIARPSQIHFEKRDRFFKFVEMDLRKESYLRPDIQQIPFYLEQCLLDGSNEPIVDGGEHGW
jgi:hypothetical protein